jgi:hypothetical protein
MQAKVGESTKSSLKTEVLNCVEHLLVLDEISTETYYILTKVLGLLDCENEFNLGDGLKLKLVDCNK